MVRTMLKKDEQVLIVPASGDHEGVRLVPVKKGDRVVPFPTRDGRWIRIKLSPLTRGDRIVVVTLRNGRKVALKLEEFSDADLKRRVELAGDLTLEFREGGAP